MTPPEFFGTRLLRQAPELSRAFFEGPFLSASTGRSDLLDHLPDFVSALGSPLSPAEFLRTWLESEHHPNLALWASVRRLKERGWRVYLATNQERHRTTYLLEVVGLSDLVDGEFASCSVGHRKPHAPYYEEVTRRLDIAPSRIVFWDDSPTNVVAARQAGWTAHEYDSAASFERIMGLEERGS